MSKSKKVRFVMADAKAKIQELASNRDEWADAFAKKKDQLEKAEKKINNANSKLAELNAVVQSYLAIWTLKTITETSCSQCGCPSGASATVLAAEQSEVAKALMLVDEKIREVQCAFEEEKDDGFGFIQRNRY
jgi:chromosome segregation ATPase